MSEERRLQLRKLIEAPVERVFLACTDAEKMSRWFSPKDMTASVEMQPTVGGTYRVEMKETSGKLHTASGTVKEVIQNKKLVMSWRWEGPEGYETLLTIELLPRGGATEVVLTHQGFSSDEGRDNHEKGWKSCLENLSAKIATL